MKKGVPIVIALFAISAIEVNAQLDAYSNQQLVRELEVEQDPREIDKIYTSLINRYLNNDLDSTYIFASDYLEFAEESGDPVYIIRAQYNLGRYYGNKGESIEAINALKIAQELADVNFGTSEEELAQQGRIVGMIGFIYYTNDQFDTALEYYKQALTYFEQLGTQRPLAISISTIGSIYYQQGAIRPAKNYYEQSLRIKEELKDSLLMTSDIKNIAMIYQEWGQLDSARVFLERALEIDTKTGARRKLIGTYRDLTRLHLELGEGDIGLSYALKAVELAEEYNSYTNLERAYEVLYEAYDYLGDDAKALESFILFHTYKDSVVNAESKAALIDAQERYESTKREQEIGLLESQNQLQKARITLVSVVLGASLLVSILVFLKIVFRKRNELKIKEKDKLISDSQRKLAEEELEKEKLRAEYIQKELTNYALHIAEKNDFLEEIKEQIYDIRFSPCQEEIRKELIRIEMKIFQNVKINEEREELQSKVDELCSGFFLKLKSQFPDLTENDRRLAVFLRLNLSSKDIANILNIEPKSVQQSRYRLRKKLGLNPGEDLQVILNTI